jgi:hypothetical protein
VKQLMIGEQHVLIISTVADIATDDVVKRLDTLGVPHRRLNTEDYPFSRTLTFNPQGHRSNIVSDGEVVPTPSSVWYRRIRSPSKPPDMDEGVYDFCLQESRAAMLGCILNLPVQWMSHPTAVWQSEFKPYQLSLASQLGLPIPRTVITNDQNAVREAFKEFKEMVIKPARSGYFTENGQPFSIFTSRVLEEHLYDLGDAQLSPAIYQQFIRKVVDVRVTIIGERVFAAAIESQSDPEAMIDWRKTTNPELPHRRLTLPESITDLLLQLMKSLGLSFGAIDMVRDTKGDYIFLEVNPSGQWLWIDEKLGFGISDAIADWLGKGFLCR